MSATSLRRVVSVTLIVAILVTVMSGAAAAGQAEKKKNKKKAAKPKGPPAALEIVRGKSLKVAKAKVVKRWVRIQDEIGDPLLRDGTVPDETPAWADIAEVYVGRNPTVRKLLTKMEQDYPEGTARAYRGADADWHKGDDTFYVVVVTDGKLPGDSDPGVQVVVTFDGEEAVPARARSGLGPYAGAQTFSISGSFQDGPWASGTTDLSGWAPPDEPPLFNAPAPDMGLYDRNRGAFMHVAQVPDGAGSATVTLRSDGPQGEVFDTLELPFGGRFMELDDPTWGLTVNQLDRAVTCRSLATEGPDGETGMTSIVYTVGWPETAATGERVAALGESIELPVTEVGVDDDPRITEARVELGPDGDSATFTLAVPAGQWLLDGSGLEGLPTPAGQALIDMRPLTGSAGVLTGEGLTGFVAGDVECGVAQETSATLEPVPSPEAEADAASPQPESEASPGS